MKSSSIPFIFYSKILSKKVLHQTKQSENLAKRDKHFKHPWAKISPAAESVCYKLWGVPPTHVFHQAIRPTYSGLMLKIIPKWLLVPSLKPNTLTQILHCFQERNKQKVNIIGSLQSSHLLFSFHQVQNDLTSTQNVWSLYALPVTYAGITSWTYPQPFNSSLIFHFLSNLPLPQTILYLCNASTWTLLVGNQISSFIHSNFSCLSQKAGKIKGNIKKHKYKLCQRAKPTCCSINYIKYTVCEGSGQASMHVIIHKTFQSINGYLNITEHALE